MSYPQTTGGDTAPRPSSLTERLIAEKAHIESRLKTIDEILARFDRDPGLGELLDSIAKLDHLY